MDISEHILDLTEEKNTLISNSFYNQLFTNIVRQYICKTIRVAVLSDSQVEDEVRA